MPTITFTNENILNELKKSGVQFAELFIRNNAEFTPLIQSAKPSMVEAVRYAAQVNDVVTIAHHNQHNNTWKFKSIVMMP